MTTPNRPIGAGLAGGGLWPAHVPRPQAPGTPTQASRPAPAGPARVEEVASLRMPWHGVQWTLIYVGLLGYIFTITTYRLPIGDVSMVVALFGLLIQKERLRVPPLLVGLGLFLRVVHRRVCRDGRADAGVDPAPDRDQALAHRTGGRERAAHSRAAAILRGVLARLLRPVSGSRRDLQLLPLPRDRRRPSSLELHLLEPERPRGVLHPSALARRRATVAGEAWPREVGDDRRPRRRSVRDPADEITRRVPGLRRLQPSGGDGASESAARRSSSPPWWPLS